MAEPQPTAREQQKGMGEVVSELWQLVKDYGRQETIDPLRDLGRFVGFGAVGSVVLGVGLILLTLGLLRALQHEANTTFDGNLTVLPYAIALVVTALLAALAARAITKKPKTKARARA